MRGNPNLQSCNPLHQYAPRSISIELRSALAIRKPQPKAKPLTAERLRELVSYDPNTGIMRWRLCRKKCAPNTVVGTKIGKGYLSAGLDYGKYLVHRLAFLYMAGRWPEHDVDHINGDRLDNRWCNLREATRTQNMYNQPPPRNNTSGFKNVYWSKSEQLWRVMVKTDHRSNFIGRFHDKAEAVKARDAALIRLHGEFAHFG